MSGELYLVIVVVSLVVGILVEIGSKKISYGIAALLALGTILTLLATIAPQATP